LEFSLSISGEIAGQCLELEVALGGNRVRIEELGEAMDLARPKRNIDEWKSPEDLILQRLGPTAPDTDDLVGALSLEALGIPQVSQQLRICRLSDGAGVEEDQVRDLTVINPAIAERSEHAGQPLGVVHIHLAPEGG
jgi:hypothetical protein